MENSSWLKFIFWQKKSCLFIWEFFFVGKTFSSNGIGKRKLRQGFIRLKKGKEYQYFVRRLWIKKICAFDVCGWMMFDACFSTQFRKPERKTVFLFIFRPDTTYSSTESILCHLMVIKIYAYRFEFTCGSCRCDKFNQIHIGFCWSLFPPAPLSLSTSVSHTVLVFCERNDIYYLLIDF